MPFVVFHWFAKSFLYNTPLHSKRLLRWLSPYNITASELNFDVTFCSLLQAKIIDQFRNYRLLYIQTLTYWISYIDAKDSEELRTWSTALGGRAKKKFARGMQDAQAYSPCNLNEASNRRLLPVSRSQPVVVTPFVLCPCTAWGSGTSRAGWRRRSSARRRCWTRRSSWAPRIWSPAAGRRRTRTRPPRPVVSNGIANLPSQEMNCESICQAGCGSTWASRSAGHRSREACLVGAADEVEVVLV